MRILYLFRSLLPLAFASGVLVTGGCSTCDRCGEGCHFWEHHDACADIPKGAIPQPPGTYSKQWQFAQSSSAERELFTLYFTDWRAHTAQLGPFGQQRFEQIVAHLHQYPFPIVVERSEQPDLDEQRRVALIEELAGRGVPNPQERVVVGYSTAYSLYGVEAKSVARGAIEREQSPDTTVTPSRTLRSNLTGAYGSY